MLGSRPPLIATLCHVTGGQEEVREADAEVLRQSGAAPELVDQEAGEPGHEGGESVTS